MPDEGVASTDLNRESLYKEGDAQCEASTNLRHDHSSNVVSRCALESFMMDTGRVGVTEDIGGRKPSCIIRWLYSIVATFLMKKSGNRAISTARCLTSSPCYRNV